MKLTDFSELRSSETIEIPLNGKTYEAITDPAGAIVLGMTTSEIDPDLLAMAGKDNGDIDQSLLTAGQKVEALRAMKRQVTKQIRFLDQVLTPASAEQWRYYFMPLPEAEEGKAGPTKKVRDDHAAHRITAEQMAAVTRELVKVYSGQRPTAASSSSSNGDGASGRTSTAGVPAEE